MVVQKTGGNPFFIVRPFCSALEGCQIDRGSSFSFWQRFKGTGPTSEGRKKKGLKE